DRPPNDATLRAFAQDPIIEEFWRAYWDRFLANGGDPAQAEEVACSFRTEVLPTMLESPHVIIEMLVEGRRERLDEERASRALAEIGLVQRIESAWGEGLTLLDGMISFAEELLGFVRRRVTGGLPDEDWTRAALLLILARGIQTSWEIRTLLRNGYASGAWARWRTLHELSVLAKFIGKHGDTIAKAYLAHDDVQALRTIQAWEKSSATPETWAAHRKIQEERVRELESKYGKELFKRDYGWAGLAFPNVQLKYPKPALDDLEDEVGLTHLRGMRKKADHAVHAGARGYNDNPGHPVWPSQTLLAGPSPFGLDQVAVWTAESLTSLAGAFVRDDAIPSETLTIGAIIQLKEQVGDALSTARNGTGKGAVQKIIPTPPSETPL
ncbi:MAG TPA: DUF5677 domain-containing protein, partial [Myxococcaceae bacterium]